MKKTIILLIPLLIAVQFCFAQQVSGLLKDQNGQPLTEITVALKKGKNRTISNDHGFFQIILSSDCDTLVFSALHINRYELAVCSGDELELVLERKQNHLDEVVIMGYTNTTQRYLVGSVTKIDGADIAKQPVGNPLLALHGRVPGMTVSASSGLPGASVTIQVRGQNALKPDFWGSHYVDPPLFIIDGIPFSSQNQNLNQFRSVLAPSSTENPYGGFSPFNSIDPQSIESIEVLKDADATAIYGSRGGNGVILITTKGGKLGKTQFDASIVHGISMIGKTMPMMDTKAYLEMRREAYKNDGLSPNLIPFLGTYAPDLLAFDSIINRDWKDYFLGNSAQNSAGNINISGGNEYTRFLIGGSVRRETFIYPGNFADWKNNFNTNLLHQTKNGRFSLNFSLLYSNNLNQAISTTDIIDVLKKVPNYPDPIDEDGNLIWSVGDLKFTNFYDYNPIAYLYHPYEIKNTLLNTGLNINFRFAKGLNGKMSFGHNSMKSAEWSTYTREGSSPFENPFKRSANFGAKNLSSLIVEPQLSYKSFFAKGTFELLIGSSMQIDRSHGTLIYTEGHLDDDLLRSISAAPKTSASDQHGVYKFMAGFARANYIWDKKLIANLTYRRDGSSRFGPDKRFGNFGAIGLGWIFKDENREKTDSFISFGKLRGSWGLTGSDNTSPYQYISRWAPVGGAYQGAMGYAPQNLFNAELSWSKTQKTEFGLDLGFLQDRVYLTATWFRNLSGNQLVNYRLPFQTGFNSVPINWDAVVENSGLEVSLNGIAVKDEFFDWTIQGNISLPKNRLVKFDGIETSSYSNKYLVGKSLNLLLGFEFAGVNSESGIFEYYNADGGLTQRPVAPSSGQLNDFKYLGNLDPKFYGGINNQFRYKNISFSVFVEFKSRYGANFLRQVYSSSVGQVGNLPAVMEDRWRKPGDIARFMKVTTLSGSRDNPTNQIFPLSSGAYGDATYARLKHTQLNWRIPKKWKKGLISEFNISFSGHNILTWTKYEGNDPETLSFYAVPPLKTFVVGIQAKIQ